MSGGKPGIQDLINRLENPRPFLISVAALLKARTIERIKTTKKDPAGVPWVRWAASTARARSRKGNAGRGLLWDSGNLVSKISGRTQSNNTVVVGVNGVPYANYLQNGTTRMPARPFIGIGQQDQLDIRANLLSHLKGITK